MMYLRMLLIFAFLFLLNSCDKDQNLNEQDEFFVFGNYFGFCQGDCAHLYKFQNDLLFADIIENIYADLPIQFETFSLEREDLALTAKQLKSSIPEILISSPDSIIGCPDCYDQGGYYLQIFNSNTDRSWYIDTNTRNLDPDIKTYLDEMDELLKKLAE